MKITPEQLEQTKQKALAVTSQCREKEDSFSLDKAGKEMKLAVLIQAMGVNDVSKGVMTEIIETITDLKLPRPTDPESVLERTFPPFSMVVPTMNHNSHDYPIGVAVLMRGEDEDGDPVDRGIRITGGEGNHINWFASGCRWATDEEIEKYFYLTGELVKLGIEVDSDFPIVKDDKR